MKKSKPEAKKTVEQAIKAGDLVVLDKDMAKAMGIMAPVAMSKEDYNGLDIAAKHRQKGQKAYKTLLNAVRWTIFKAQRQGIKSHLTLQLTAAGYPPMGLMVRPFSETDLQSVILIGKADPVKPEGAKKP